MERIWLARYPKGIPADVNVADIGSVGEMFEKSAAKFGPRAAYTNMGTAISYSELDRLTRAFAAYLQSVLKLQQGRAGRADDAEHLAISGGVVRGAAGRLHGGQLQSVVQPPRTGSST